MGGVGGIGFGLRIVAQQASKLLNLFPGAGSTVSAGIAAGGTALVGHSAVKFYIQGIDIKRVTREYQEETGKPIPTKPISTKPSFISSVAITVLNVLPLKNKKTIEHTDGRQEDNKAAIPEASSPEYINKPGLSDDGYVAKDNVFTSSPYATYRLADIKKNIRSLPMDIMLVGATGVGKSSTLNALLDAEQAKVGYGVDPETQDIQCYMLNEYIRLWDTPGLGDDPSLDKAHSQKIVELLEKHEDSQYVIDLVLVLIDASSRDIGTTYKILNDAIFKNINADRVLAVVNQADIAMKGRHWDGDKPDETLEKFLKREAFSFQKRILDTTGNLVREPLFYSASNRFNLYALLDYIIDNANWEKRKMTPQNDFQDEGRENTAIRLFVDWRYNPGKYHAPTDYVSIMESSKSEFSREQKAIFYLFLALDKDLDETSSKVFRQLTDRPTDSRFNHSLFDIFTERYDIDAIKNCKDIIAQINDSDDRYELIVDAIDKHRNSPSAYFGIHKEHWVDVLRAFAVLAAIDRVFSDNEKKCIRRYARQLGIDKQAVVELESVVNQLCQTEKWRVEIIASNMSYQQTSRELAGLEKEDMNAIKKLVELPLTATFDD
jgi:predicted GTPase